MKTILFFEGSSCCQCKAMKPNFEAECKRLGFSNYEYIDAEEEDGMAQANFYHVRALPTLIFIEDYGTVLGRASGVMAWKEIEKFVK